MFTTNPKEIDFTLNYESSASNPDDEAIFRDLGNIIEANVHDHTDAGSLYQRSQRLTGTADAAIGSVLTIPVGAGDRISASVYAKYLAPTTTNNPGVAIGALLAAAISGGTGGTTYEGAINSSYGTSGSIITNLFNDQVNATEPMAFLNLLFLPREGASSIEPGQFTFKQIGSASSNAYALLTLDEPFEAPGAGYLVVYLSNESEVLTEVYFDDLEITVNEHPVVQTADYYPFGLTFNSFQRVTAKENKYKFNGKERITDFELNWDDFGARMYMPEIGRWGVIDPMNEIMPEWSPYNYTLNNPFRYIDPDGMIPWPVNETFKGFTRRVSSWFGKRKVRNNPKATTDHKGLDINFGSKRDDFGASVLATHDGKVHEVKDDTEGNGGRRIVIQAEDGSFQTLYFHLSKVTVKEGDDVKEGAKIGEIGSSAFGSEKGTDSHLHYGIKKRNPKTDKLEWFNPTEGKGNKESNIVDPQSWLEDPLGDAYQNIIKGAQTGIDEISRWIAEFERLQNEQDKDDN